MGEIRKTLVAIGVILILSVSLFYQSLSLQKAKSEKDRYRRNTESLLTDIDAYRMENGELVAKVADLELTKRDIEKMMAEDAKVINTLRKRNEELDRMVKTSTETEVVVETIVKDSIIYVRGEAEKIDVIEWEDPPWEKFHADIREGKTANIRLNHRDEVDVLVFLEYKKFLFWKTKLKGCNVDVVSHNPYTKNIDVSSISVIK